MDWYYIILIVLAAIIAVIFIIVAYVFVWGFARRKDNNRLASVLDDIEKSGTDDSKKILAGIAYLKTLKSEDVFIKSRDGLSLHARFVDNGADCTIILCHGYRSYAEFDFSCAIRPYTEMGLNLLLIDERAHSKSEGKYLTFGVFERYDICGWSNYIVEKLGKNQKIILGGMSMGSSSVLLAAALDEMPESFCGVIADCGYVSPRREFVYLLKHYYHLPPFPLISILNLYCKVFAHFGVSDVSTLDAVKKLRVPILFVHGETDTFVPFDNTADNYAACASPDKEIIAVPDAEHGLSYLRDEENCKARITAFVKKCRS